MRVLPLLLMIALSACATAMAPINAPLSGFRAPVEARQAQGEDLIVLALSGGGARAASFELGVLQYLRETPGRDGRPLSEHVALVTAVSGGAVLAAYYGLHGDEGLDAFRAAYLDQSWRLNGLSSPSAWFGAVRGGMNRPDAGADWLDEHLYHGARMGEMGRGPRVVINATDIYNSTPFAFTPVFFDAICSDLANIRVADAVSASMAVPVAFRPVLLQSHGRDCQAPAWVGRVRADRAAPELVRATGRAFENYAGASPADQRFLYLADGGVIDNFGVTSLSILRAAGPAPAPLTVREAVQARRILFLVVNSERERPRTFQQRAGDLGGYEMVYAPLDASTDAAKRAALDAFAGSLRDLRTDLQSVRCALSPEQLAALRGAGGGWDCNAIDLSLETISLRDLDEAQQRALIDTATDVSLPRERVDALIAAGRSVAAGNAAIRSLQRD
ncbi:patatin-like phospholipase family protein [Terricaulis sp.]|uniref:patatin-like phospholipase family protein n=1 Tax=Terricaulis sp. TaxID=2768686 RepID=UPI00378515FB